MVYHTCFQTDQLNYVLINYIWRIKVKLCLDLYCYFFIYLFFFAADVGQIEVVSGPLEDAQLNCVVDLNGLTKKEVKWYHGDDLVKKSSRIKIQANETLDYLTIQDVGKNYCTCKRYLHCLYRHTGY